MRGFFWLGEQLLTSIEEIYSADFLRTIFIYYLLYIYLLFWLIENNEVTNGDLYQAHSIALLGRFAGDTTSFVMYGEYLHKYQA
jgi:hypothetical protein